MNDKAINRVDRSIQVVENQEALPQNAKNKLASIVNHHAQTKTVPSSAHNNQTSTESSSSFQEMPPSSLLPCDLQPEQCGQDNVAMDVDSNLDYNTNSDLSAMIVDETDELKSIHPFFKKPYPTSSLTTTSEKEQADLK